MSAIADLAALLVSQGCSADVVRSVIDLTQKHATEMAASITAASADVVRQSADVGGLSSDVGRASAAERRKEYDRKRQAEIRRLKRLSKEPPLILTSLPSSSEETLEERKKLSGIRARARKQLSPLPENWQPPDIAYPLAVECGTTVPAVEAIFRDYLKSSGKLYADHNAAFCNFVRNQRKFNGNNSEKNNGRRTVHDAARELHERTVAAVLAFDEPTTGGICEREGADAVRLLPPR